MSFRRLYYLWSLSATEAVSQTTARLYFQPSWKRTCHSSPNIISVLPAPASWRSFSIKPGPYHLNPVSLPFDKTQSKSGVHSVTRSTNRRSTVASLTESSVCMSVSPTVTLPYWTLRIARCRVVINFRLVVQAVEALSFAAWPPLATGNNKKALSSKIDSMNGNAKDPADPRFRYA